eukprot:1158258-Pelagomonas_calceolata.AAC.6
MNFAAVDQVNGHRAANGHRAMIFLPQTTRGPGHGRKNKAWLKSVCTDGRSRCANADALLNSCLRQETQMRGLRENTHGTSSQIAAIPAKEDLPASCEVLDHGQTCDGVVVLLLLILLTIKAQQVLHGTMCHTRELTGQLGTQPCTNH